MLYKKIIFLFFISAFIVFFIFSSLLFFFDPLKIMHKPWVFKTYLQPDMREQAAGIIKNYDFDGIILGTSMLDSTSSRECVQKLKGESFFNLSIKASDFSERSIVLNYVLKNKKIKTVLYSLDNTGLIENQRGDVTDKSNQWTALYDENGFNDFFSAYFNYKYIKCIFSKSCMGKEVDWDRPNAWIVDDDNKHWYGLDKWFAAKGNKGVQLALELIPKTVREGKKTEIDQLKLLQKHKNSKAYFDETLLGYISQNRSTDFILIVPPYSRISYALQAQYEKESFALYEMNIKYLVSMSKKYPNMKVYAWGNETFVDEISNYADLHHYEYWCNSYILDQIQKGNGLLTEDNIDVYFKTFTQKALAYDLKSLADLIEQHKQ